MLTGGSPESSESSEACPGITGATSVRILLPPGTVPLHQNAYLLSDPGAVRQLVNFVNLRRNVDPLSAETAPYPTVKATFYYGDRNVGIFGSGGGFFYLQCGTTRGARQADAAGLEEFQRLIARPNASQ